MILTEQLPEAPFDVTVLRPATKGDYLCVRGMFFDYLCEVRPFGHDVEPTWPNADWYWDNVFLPEIKRHTDTNMVILAAHEGVPVAALFWAMAPDGGPMDKTVIDHGVFVRRAHRGENLGNQMQQHALMLAKHHGATSVFSTVLMGNKHGIASAKKLGCEFTGYTTKVRI